MKLFDSFFNYFLGLSAQLSGILSTFATIFGSFTDKWCKWLSIAICIAVIIVSILSSFWKEARVICAGVVDKVSFGNLKKYLEYFHHFNSQVNP